MATPIELFGAGKLKEAIACATDLVKKNPADEKARGDLVDLLLFAGELERADKHLEVLTPSDPQKAIGYAQFRQLVRAEQHRHQFFAEGNAPALMEEANPRIRMLLEASIHLRKGEHAEAGKLALAAREHMPEIKGKHNGKEFTDLLDLDHMLLGVFELLAANGKYYWMPLEKVEAIEFKAGEGQRSMKDVLWRPARLSTWDGSEADVWMPSIYYGSHKNPDEAYALGRTNSFEPSAPGGPVRGLGMREFLIGDDYVPIIEMGEIEFTK